MMFKIVTLSLQFLPYRIKLLILGFFTTEREYEKKKQERKEFSQEPMAITDNSSTKMTFSRMIHRLR